MAFLQYSDRLRVSSFRWRINAERYKVVHAFLFGDVGAVYIHIPRREESGTIYSYQAKQSAWSVCIQSSPVEIHTPCLAVPGYGRQQAHTRTIVATGLGAG